MIRGWNEEAEVSLATGGADDSGSLQTKRVVRE